MQNELLKLIRKVDDNWFEAINNSNQNGIIPCNYVETLRLPLCKWRWLRLPKEESNHKSIATFDSTSYFFIFILIKFRFTRSTADLLAISTFGSSFASAGLTYTSSGPSNASASIRSAGIVATVCSPGCLVRSSAPVPTIRRLHSRPEPVVLATSAASIVITQQADRISTQLGLHRSDRISLIWCCFFCHRNCQRTSSPFVASSSSALFATLGAVRSPLERNTRGRLYRTSSGRSSTSVAQTVSRALPVSSAADGRTATDRRRHSQRDRTLRRRMVCRPIDVDRPVRNIPRQLCWISSLKHPQRCVLFLFSFFNYVFKIV